MPPISGKNTLEDLCSAAAVGGGRRYVSLDDDIDGDYCFERGSSKKRRSSLLFGSNGDNDNSFRTMEDDEDELPSWLLEEKLGKERSLEAAATRSSSSVRELRSSTCSSSTSTVAAGTQEEVEILQTTVTALTQSLRELNDELRVRSTECDALRETVSALSKALSESERHSDELALRCEHLDLKLQGVTFCDKKQIVPEVSHTSAASGTKTNKKKKHASGKKGQRLLKTLSLSEDSDYDYDDEDDDEGTTDEESDSEDTPSKRLRRKMKGLKGATTGSPVDSVTTTTNVAGKTGNEAKNETGMATALTNGTGAQQSQQGTPPAVGSLPGDPAPILNTAVTPLSGPGQAAFYNVILERDQARRHSDRLQQELNVKREQVKRLKAKLNKSTALIELSYDCNAPTTLTKISSATTTSCTGASAEQQQQQQQQQQQHHANIGKSDSIKAEARQQLIHSASPLKRLLKGGGGQRSAKNKVSSAKDDMSVQYSSRTHPQLHQRRQANDDNDDSNKKSTYVPVPGDGAQRSKTKSHRFSGSPSRCLSYEQVRRDAPLTDNNTAKTQQPVAATTDAAVINYGNKRAVISSTATVPRRQSKNEGTAAATPQRQQKAETKPFPASKDQTSQQNSMELHDAQRSKSLGSEYLQDNGRERSVPMITLNSSRPWEVDGASPFPSRVSTSSRPWDVDKTAVRRATTTAIATQRQHRANRVGSTRASANSNAGSAKDRYKQLVTPTPVTKTKPSTSAVTHHLIEL